MPNNAVQVGVGLYTDKASLNQSTREIKGALGRITGNASEFQKSLDASTARVFAFGATTTVISGVSLAFQALISTTIEVEKRLVEINSIFGGTTSQLNQFRETIFQVAKDTGQSFSTVADAASEFARQGLSATETAKRLNDALILSRISGLDSVKSVKTLTSAINGFTSAGLSSTQVVDKITAVDRKFSVSAEDLSNALARAGSTAEDAGVNLDEFLGIVTAVERRTSRGGAVIGNALKTIFTRISRGGVIEDLQALGVAIDASQSGVQKLQAIGEAFESALGNPTRQNAIKELAAGGFQINILSAALKDLTSQSSAFGEATKVSQDSAGTAAKENAELQKSLAAQLNSLVVGFTNLAEKVGSITLSPLLKGLTEAAGLIDEFLNKALDPEKGNALVQGLLKTIGAFVSGPGLVLIATGFFKIIKLVAGFAKEGFKTVLALGSAAENIRTIEKAIVGQLNEGSALRATMLSTTATQAQKQQAVNKALSDANELHLREQKILRETAQIAAGLGVRGRTDAGIYTGKGGKPLKAKGFAPSFSETVAETSAAREHGYKAGKVFNTKLYDGQGGSFKATVNSAEKIKTVRGENGKLGTYVIPPNGMAAKGFVPNYAGFNNIRFNDALKDLGRLSVAQLQKKLVGARTTPEEKAAGEQILAKKLSEQKTKEADRTKISGASYGMLVPSRGTIRTESPLEGSLNGKLFSVDNFNIRGPDFSKVDSIASPQDEKLKKNITSQILTESTKFANSLGGSTVDAGGILGQLSKSQGALGGINSAVGAAFDLAVASAFPISKYQEAETNALNKIGGNFDVRNIGSNLKNLFNLPSSVSKADFKATDSTGNRSSMVGKMMKEQGVSSAQKASTTTFLKDQEKRGKFKAGGFVPNFAPFKKDSIGDGRKKYSTSFGSYANVFPDSSRKQINLDYISSKKKGDAYKLFKHLSKIAKRSKSSIYASELVPQIKDESDPFSKAEKGSTNWEKLLSIFPQLKYRQLPKSTTSGNVTSRSSSFDGFGFESLDGLEGLVNGMSKKQFEDDFSEADISNIRTKMLGGGFIPNFGMMDALKAAKFAGKSAKVFGESLPKGTMTSALKGDLNPDAILNHLFEFIQRPSELIKSVSDLENAKSAMKTLLSNDKLREAFAQKIAPRLNTTLYNNKKTVTAEHDNLDQERFLKYKLLGGQKELKDKDNPFPLGEFPAYTQKGKFLKVANYQETATKEAARKAQEAGLRKSHNSSLGRMLDDKGSYYGSTHMLGGFTGKIAKKGGKEFASYRDEWDVKLHPAEREFLYKGLSDPSSITERSLLEIGNSANTYGSESIEPFILRELVSSIPKAKPAVFKGVIPLANGFVPNFADPNKLMKGRNADQISWIKASAAKLNLPLNGETYAQFAKLYEKNVSVNRVDKSGRASTQGMLNLFGGGFVPNFASPMPFIAARKNKILADEKSKGGYQSPADIQEANATYQARQLSFQRNRPRIDDFLRGLASKYGKTISIGGDPQTETGPNGLPMVFSGQKNVKAVPKFASLEKNIAAAYGLGGAQTALSNEKQLNSGVSSSSKLGYLYSQEVDPNQEFYGNFGMDDKKYASQKGFSLKKTRENYPNTVGKTLNQALPNKNFSPESLSQIVNQGGDGAFYETLFNNNARSSGSVLFRGGTSNTVELPISKLSPEEAAKLKRIMLAQSSVQNFADGFVPNFSAVQDAISREKKAGVPSSAIYIDQSPKLKSTRNPSGLMVANRIDEPRGGFQGINRAKREGKNPKSYGAAGGFVPNFAPQIGKIKNTSGIGIKELGNANKSLSDLSISLRKNQISVKDAISAFDLFVSSLNLSSQGQKLLSAKGKSLIGAYDLEITARRKIAEGKRPKNSAEGSGGGSGGGLGMGIGKFFIADLLLQQVSGPISDFVAKKRGLNEEEAAAQRASIDNFRYIASSLAAYGPEINGLFKKITGGKVLGQDVGRGGSKILKGAYDAVKGGGKGGAVGAVSKLGPIILKTAVNFARLITTINPLGIVIASAVGGLLYFRSVTEKTSKALDMAAKAGEDAANSQEQLLSRKLSIKDAFSTPDKTSSMKDALTNFDSVMSEIEKTISSKITDKNNGFEEKAKTNLANRASRNVESTTDAAQKSVSVEQAAKKDLTRIHSEMWASIKGPDLKKLESITDKDKRLSFIKEKTPSKLTEYEDQQKVVEKATENRKKAEKENADAIKKAAEALTKGAIDIEISSLKLADSIEGASSKIEVLGAKIQAALSFVDKALSNKSSVQQIAGETTLREGSKNSKLVEREINFAKKKNEVLSARSDFQKGFVQNIKTTGEDGKSVTTNLLDEIKKSILSKGETPEALAKLKEVESSFGSGEFQQESLVAFMEDGARGVTNQLKKVLPDINAAGNEAGQEILKQVTEGAANFKKASIESYQAARNSVNEISDALTNLGPELASAAKESMSQLPSKLKEIQDGPNVDPLKLVEKLKEVVNLKKKGKTKEAASALASASGDVSAYENLVGKGKASDLMERVGLDRGDRDKLIGSTKAGKIDYTSISSEAEKALGRGSSGFGKVQNAITKAQGDPLQIAELIRVIKEQFSSTRNEGKGKDIISSLVDSTTLEQRGLTVAQTEKQALKEVSPDKGTVEEIKQAIALLKESPFDDALFEGLRKVLASNVENPVRGSDLASNIRVAAKAEKEREAQKNADDPLRALSEEQGNLKKQLEFANKRVGELASAINPTGLKASIDLIIDTARKASENMASFGRFATALSSLDSAVTAKFAELEGKISSASK